MIDEYQKYDDYSPLAWEEFEEAFNSVAKELFVPKQKEFKMQKNMTTRYVLLVKYASYQLMFISDTQFASALV
jgi:hypothetical protein